MKRYSYGLLLILIGLLFFSSCEEQDNFDVDVSQIPVKVEVVRFDKDFYGRDTARFASIKKKYNFLFSERIPDSVWKAKMKDSLLLDLKTQVDSVFSDLKPEKQAVSNLFKHIKYYNENWKEPKIYTLYSDWNYLMRAVYMDSLLFLPLDNYLGTKSTVYKGVPEYIRQNMSRQRIAVEIAKSIAEQQTPKNKKRDFLSEMIRRGKILYLLDIYLPKTSDALKIGYTEKKMKWAENNEEDVWKYFITKDYLYSFDTGLHRRFLELAPYSKFYSEKDMESPGGIGGYIGWKIVRSFMQKNKVSLQQMLKMSADDIFKQSKYKPRR